MNTAHTLHTQTPRLPSSMTMRFLFSLIVSMVLLFAPVQSFFTMQSARWISAFSIVLSYLLFTQTVLQRHRKKHSQPAANAAQGQDEICIVYASQTGYAEELALQTEQSLQQAQCRTRLLDIDAVTPELLQHSKRLLFIVSTTGEGDAPDSAARFCDQVMAHTLALPHLHYAVLALGDSHYQSFCAFGRQLDHWLHQQGAQLLFDRVEVDDGDDGALRHWQHHLGLLSGHTELPDWHQASYQDWTLDSRELLNPGSQGNPVYKIRLTTEDANTHWQAGDIAEILPQRPGISTALPHREYSIASLPQDGAVELIVRQMQQADGSLGLGSGWLTQYAEVGSRIELRLRSNRSFQPQELPRPLILIGNGTGIAGLRAHLKHCEHIGSKGHYLFFGERQSTHDHFCQTELEHWLKQGTLAQLSVAFSRDQEQRLYVQHLLPKYAQELREQIAQGAAIYVCGSLAGMASEVDQTLRTLLGDDVLESLREQGRYRRDVY